jgi:hypothetical protein
MSSRKSFLALLLFFLAILRPLTLQGMYEEIPDDDSDSPTSSVGANTGTANIDRFSGSENFSMTDNENPPLYSETGLKTDRKNSPSSDRSQFPPITLNDFKNAIHHYPQAKAFIIRNGKLEPEDNPSSHENNAVRRAWMEALQQEYGDSSDLSSITDKEPLLPKSNTNPLSASDITSHFREIDSIIQQERQGRAATSRPVLAQAQKLDEVKEWPSSYEIRHDGNQYYATHKREMDSITNVIRRVFQRTEFDRKEHRRAIDKIATELAAERLLNTSYFLQKRFGTRKLLGQPITVEALHDYLDQSEQFLIPGTLKDILRGMATISNVLQKNSPRRHDYEQIRDTLPRGDLNPFAEKTHIPLDSSFSAFIDENEDFLISSNSAKPLEAWPPFKHNLSQGVTNLFSEIFMPSSHQARPAPREKRTYARDYKLLEGNGYTPIQESEDFSGTPLHQRSTRASNEEK